MAAEPLDGKRAEFVSRAGQAFDRMFGTDGQNGLATFAQREDRACEVTDELVRWPMAEPLKRLGPASTPGPPDEPRQVLAATLAYVSRNRQRMDYPRYRRQGLERFKIAYVRGGSGDPPRKGVAYARNLKML